MLYIPGTQHFCQVKIYQQIQVRSHRKWKVKWVVLTTESMTHMPKLLFPTCIELNEQVLPPLLNHVEVRGINWSCLSYIGLLLWCQMKIRQYPHFQLQYSGRWINQSLCPMLLLSDPELYSNLGSLVIKENGTTNHRVNDTYT